MPMRTWIFLACGANLPLWLPPPAPHKKSQSAWRFNAGAAKEGSAAATVPIGASWECPRPPKTQNPKFPLAARGAAVDTRHPAAGAIQGPGRPARGAFAPGPVEGRHSAVQNSSAPLTSAACGARLELKPRW